MPAEKNSNFKFKILNCPAFTLVELMISISIIAILTAAAIPSFTDFSKSQTLTQNFKTLKSDLRIAQSRSISGATVAGAAKAWGIYFVVGDNRYTIFACAPATTLAEYSRYLHGNSSCSDVKNVNLGSQVKILSLVPNIVSILNVVFDAQNGAAYANTQSGKTITIRLSYTDGSSPLPVTITAGGGISD